MTRTTLDATKYFSETNVGIGPLTLDELQNTVAMMHTDMDHAEIAAINARTGVKHPMTHSRRFTMLVVATREFLALYSIPKAKRTKTQKLALRKAFRCKDMIESWLMTDWACSRTRVRELLTETRAYHDRMITAFPRFEREHLQQVRTDNAAREAAALKPNTGEQHNEYMALLDSMLRAQHFDTSYNWALGVMTKAAASTPYDILETTDIDDLVDSFMSEVDRLAEVAFNHKLDDLRWAARNWWPRLELNIEHALQNNTDFLAHAELSAMLTSARALLNDAEDNGCGQYASAIASVYLTTVMKDRLGELGILSSLATDTTTESTLYRPNHITTTDTDTDYSTLETWKQIVSVQVPTWNDPTSWTASEIALHDYRSNGTNEELFREMADLDDIEVLQELYDGIYAADGEITDEDRAQIEGFALDRLHHLAGMR